jgi:hypothetical protein
MADPKLHVVKEGLTFDQLHGVRAENLDPVSEPWWSTVRIARPSSFIGEGRD